MHVALRRLSRTPYTAPEWGEVLVNAIAIGWAWNFMLASRFGPPGSTVRHVVDALGPVLPPAWAVATAILPPLSIMAGYMVVRLFSTLVCGCMWSVILFVSIWAGTPLSGFTATAFVGIVALFWSQRAVLLAWRHERQLGT